MYPIPVRVPAPKKVISPTSFLYRKSVSPPDEMLRQRNEFTFADLIKMRERFQRLGRKILIDCGKDGSLIPIEMCLANCQQVGCVSLQIDNIKGKEESKSDVLNDIIKLQRIVNILYHGHDDGKEEERDPASAKDKRRD